MDSDNIAALIRGLRTTPSRRAVSTAVVALLASSALAPLFGPEASEGKGKGKGKKKHKKKKNPKDLLPKCATGQIQCDDLQCCATNLCTSCGCCPETQPNCCGDATTANRLCYSPANETCCPPGPAKIVGACAKGTVCGPYLGGVPFCCPSGATLCAGFGCCPQGLFCCGGVCCDNIACKPDPEGSCFPEPIGTPARIT